MADDLEARYIEAFKRPITTVLDTRLCKLCRTLLLEPHEDFIYVCDLEIENRPPGPDIELVHQSALHGCPICHLVWNTFEMNFENASGVTRENRNFGNLLKTTASALPRLIIDTCPDTEWEHSSKLGYNFEASEGDLSHSVLSILHKDLEWINIHLLAPDIIAPKIFTSQNFPPADSSTASDSSWAKCLSWLDQCLSHEFCNQPLSVSPVLPTRLIDVGNQTTLPRLCQGRDLKSGTKYVTLSHCWGTQKIVTLTEETVGTFQQSIAMETLPKTFQDAINITRRLTIKHGIQHLWIDSLCIQQDSFEDWNREAPRMAEVYGNAWCNIAATHAPDGRTGLFSSREPTKLLPTFLKAPDHNNSEPIDHLCVVLSRWHDNIDNAPLNQRCWVTQERFLSPRILHFARGEIFFECQRGRASESFFEGEPTAILSDGLDENGYALSTVARVSTIKASLQRAIKAWCWQVKRYSSGRLTKRTDKLIAISGIAKVFQGFFKGSEYLAGLWKHDLVKQLAWIRILGPFVPEAPSATYVAPSWSWAAVEGTCLPSWVSFNNPQPLVEVIDAKVQLESDNTFGQVRDGLIRLRCHLLKGRLDNGNYVVNTLDHIQLDTVEPVESFSFNPDLNLKLRSQDLELYCVPVTYEETPSGGLTRALVLEPTHTAKGQFRRVGVADNVRNRQAEILENTMSLGITEFEDFDGTQYIISIV